MQNVVIGNATYLVNRVFVGERKITDLIQKRMEETCSQLLPLTTPPSASYNHSEVDADFRRNHAD